MKQSRSPHHWTVDLAIILLVITGGVYWYGGTEAVTGFWSWWGDRLHGAATGAAKAPEAAMLGTGAAIAGFLAIAALFLLPVFLIVAVLRLAFGRR